VYDKKAKEQTIARLTNWGVWSRVGGFPNLGTPAYVEIMKDYFPDKSPKVTPNNADAEHLENIITTMDIAGRNGFGWGDVYRLILKMEFIEHGRPQSLKANHVKRKFELKSYAERTYRYHFYRAKQEIYYLADSVALSR